MSYFIDLSDYTYRGEFYRQRTLNVGWLSAGHDFEKKDSTEGILDLLWDYCSISIAQARGYYFCDFCAVQDFTIERRHGNALMLGNAEIRVFSTAGEIYAAPNLIYHYIKMHRYAPPPGFLQALSQEPRPPREEYFLKLAKAGLDWCATTPYTSDTLILPKFGDKN